MSSDSQKPDTAGPKPSGGKKLTRLGQYRLVRKLGQGGMGAVYEAIQEGLDRRVAVKVLPKSFTRDAGFVERFRREAKSAASLNHPNIVAVYEIGEDRGFHFFSMEFVQGGSLEGRLKRQGRLSVSDAIGLMIQAVRGLASAWEQGIIHRDLKPGNLMLARDGTLKIADFGLAKAAFMGTITVEGAGMGTPYYMSPEQSYDAKNVDLRTDVYSLGATFYHLVTGRVPFEGSSPIEIGIKVSTAPLPPVRSVNAEVPVAVAEIIEKMLAKKPEERYGSGEELLAALSRLAPAPGSGVTVVEGRSLAAEAEPVIEALRLKISRKGQFNTAMYDRVADVLEQARDDQVGRELLAKAGDFAEGKMGESAFVEYVTGILEAVIGSVSAESTQRWTNSIGMEFVLIPAGAFLMGSPESEPDRRDDEHQHKVSIRRPFGLGIYVVTQGPFQRVMGFNPSFYSTTGGPSFPPSGRTPDRPRLPSVWHPPSGSLMVSQDPDRQPVDRVSWEDAQEFCRRLSASPEEKSAGWVYRLPTEAEWEYACRAGTTTRFSFGDSKSNLSEYVWSGATTTWPVGQKKPNPWGLYDMHGNVYEWCADWHSAEYYEESPMDDPTGPVSGAQRVMRGDTFLGGDSSGRSASRFHSIPIVGMHLYGFRVVSISSR